MTSTLDIVLPCFNPIEGWEKRIVASYQQLSHHLTDVELRVILVNDGSSKKMNKDSISYLQAKIPAFSYLDCPQNEGKGAALRRGINVSTSNICIFTDIDFPYTIQSFLAIFRALTVGKLDVAIGIKDDQYYSHLPKFRIKVSKFLRFLARTFLRISITDTQCGLKGFNDKGRAVFLQTTINRYLADLEFIFLVDRRKDLKMKAVKVSLRDDVEFSKVNMQILFREGVNFLRVLVRSIIGFHTGDSNSHQE